MTIARDIQINGNSATVVHSIDDIIEDAPDMHDHETINELFA